ncbi:MAG: antitoxin VapB family protein [archaeon GB-1867-035]|nr:antitoxin VapB family protein [Candidatus Culexmicrobium profundum]
MVKTITIRNEVYEMLASLKREDESFSDLIERLVKKASPIEILIKLRGCIEFKNKEQMLHEIELKRVERRP